MRKSAQGKRSTHYLIALHMELCDDMGVVAIFVRPPASVLKQGYLSPRYTVIVIIRKKFRFKFCDCVE